MTEQCAGLRPAVCSPAKINSSHKLNQRTIRARQTITRSSCCNLGIVALAAAMMLAEAIGARAQLVTVTPEWTSLTPGTLPSGRYFTGTAYDAGHGQVVLFGGLSGSTYLSDTWLWNGTNWSPVTGLVTSPAGRSGFGMTYDATQGNTVVFGGRLSASAFTGDTWVWNGSTWTQKTGLSTSPSARANMTMAYDAAMNNDVLFGGLDINGAEGDTWIWNGSAWSQVTGLSTSPASRYAYSMAYDSAHGQVVLFGGTDNFGDYLNDTWVWDGSSWTNATPSSGNPTGRYGAGMAYDLALGEVVMFGGLSSSGDLNDTWVWNGSIWTQVSPSTPPSLRESPGAMTYDVAQGEVLLFGGLSSSNADLGDTWTLASPQNLGSVSACASGPLVAPETCTVTVGLTLNFTGSIAISRIGAVTEGATEPDFSAVNAPPCIGSFSAGQSCTESVTFTPQAPGSRQGELELFGDTNVLLASIPIYGVGEAPEIAFGPAATYGASGLVTPVPNLNYSNGMTTDAAGNLYQVVGGSVLETAPGVSPATIATGFGSAEGVAIDGAGNLYVADSSLGGFGEVVELAPGCASASASCATVLYTAGSLPGPFGVAVDAVGDVFISKPRTGVFEIPASCPSCQIMLYSPGGNSSTYGVAADAAGDLFVTDSGLKKVVEIPAGCIGAGCQISIGSGWGGPQSVGVDPAGDVIVADPGLNSGAGGVVEVPAGCTSPTCQLLLWTDKPASAFFVAVNAAGEVFVANNGANPVIQINQSQPPSLSFNNTAVGLSSTQSFTVFNAGNQALDVNPANVSGAYQQIYLNGTPADCTDTGQGVTLVPGGDCNLSIKFGPTAVQSYNTSGNIQSDSMWDAFPFMNFNLSGSGVPNNTLTVTMLGAGGNVADNVDIIGCTNTNGTVTGTCSALEPNPTVTLTATPLAGATFLNWGGACASAGTNPQCVVTMSTTVNVTASFLQPSSGSAYICPSGFTPPGGSTCSTTLQVPFYFSSPVTVNSINVVTQGYSNLDFQLGSGSTCGGGYSAGGSCYVNVTFTPRAEGLREGAVVLLVNSTPGAIVSEPISGIGEEPVAALSPIPPNAYYGGGSNGLSNPSGVAVDAAGNVFVADSGNSRVLEWMPTPGKPFGTGYTTQTVGAGFSQPVAVAVDGVGNVYVADAENRNVVEVQAPWTGCTSNCQTTLYSGILPSGVAVDGAGDVFISDANYHGEGGADGVVLEYRANGGGQTIVFGSTTAEPEGLAVDASGNLFVADLHNGVVEVPVSCLAHGNCFVSIGTGWSEPQSVAVDAADDVYVADPGLNSGGGGIVEVPVGCTSNPSSCEIVSVTGTTAYGVALDPVGDIYLTDHVNGYLDIAAQQNLALTFPAIDVGTASTAQSLTFQNIGNETLTAEGQGLAITSLDFGQANQGGTGQCTTSFFLAAGANCNFSVGFAPLSGPATGGGVSDNATAIFYDNSLNNSSSPQTVPLGGTVKPGGNTLTVTVTGVGSVTDSYGAITCGSGSCSADYQPGLQVNLTATPSFGLAFTGWGGACASYGTNSTCTVTMSAAQNVTASFTTPGDTIAVQTLGPGGGTVTSTPAGINCTQAAGGSETGACGTNFNAGTQLTLTAAPAPGSVFAGWGFPCAGSNLTCTFTVNNTYDVGANFAVPNIGTSNVGTPISFQVTLSPASSATGTVIQVLTQGATGRDFTLSSSSTCAPTVTAGTYCTATISFDPSAPGLRAGAVKLLSGSGNVLATQFVSGVGQGPAVAFAPATQTTLGTGLQQPQGLAVDGAGDLFISDYQLRQVFEVPYLGNGNYGAQTTIPTTGLGNPFGIAVDGAGNLYIADPGNHQVVKVPYLGNGNWGAQTTVGSAFFPYGVAADGAGNVYVVDSQNDDVVKVTPNGVQSTVATFTSSDNPYYVALDAAGNLYVSDPGDTPQIVKIAPNGTQTEIPVSGLACPYGVAVDAAGDVYVSDACSAQVVEIPPGGSQTTLPISGLTLPITMAVDGAGDLFFGSENAVPVVEVNRSQPELWNFGSVNVGSRSGGVVYTIQNIGNQTLTGSVGSPSNANFGVDLVNSTCTSVNGISLTPGTQTCVLGIYAQPTASGVLSGTVPVSDNSLNGSPAIQNVPLQVTGVSTGTNYTLTVTPDGSGTGTVTADAISCTGSNGTVSGTCSSSYSGGTNVILTATPAAGSIFLGWGGACTELSPTCSLTMNSTQNVTANFVEQNYGTINVCQPGTTTPPEPCSTSIPVAISVPASTTVGAIQVVTQGITGLDFTQASGGTCTSFAGPGTCTVNVNFAPLAPGLRLGAVELYDTTGNLVVSAPIYGNGQAPAAAFNPGNLAVVNTGSYMLDQPKGMAVDAAGDIFIESSDAAPPQIYEVAPNGTVSTIGSGWAFPQGIAVDGAGNVYVSDNNLNEIVEVPFGCRTLSCQKVLISEATAITGLAGVVHSELGVAVDGAGDVFFSDYQDEVVSEIPANGNTPFVVYNPAGGSSHPLGLAVDAAGDLFIADNGLKQIAEVPAGCGSSSCWKTIGSGWQQPDTVSVDAAGDVYVADEGGSITTGSVVEVLPNCVTNCQIVLASGLNTVAATVDALGDVFYSNQATNQIDEIERALPPSLNFALTNVHSLSADSPKVVTVQNVGNGTIPLSVSVGPTSTSSFSENLGSTCGTSVPSLTPSASCVESFTFTPATPGILTDSAIFTDNTLNLATAVSLQTANLSGIGSVAGATGTVVPNVVGMPEAAAATFLADAGLTLANVSSGYSSSEPSGSVAGENPAAGAEVPLGTGVNLLISTGTAPAPPPNPLTFENNYFVTGDFSTAGTSLRGKGNAVTHVASGTISIPDSTSGGAQGVPDGADIVDGFLYWETLENTATPSGNTGTFLGYSITGQQVGVDVAYTDGANSGELRVYRADINNYFQAPSKFNGERLGSGPFAITLPDNGTGMPVNEGASMVEIYRVLAAPTSPLSMPLKSVVIYDGSTMPATATPQTIQGFYDAYGTPGELATLYSSGGSWNDTPTSLAVPAHASSIPVTLAANNAYAAVIFSTPVTNSDNDGILDAWKAGPSAPSFFAGEPGYYDVKTQSWVALPGALHGEKDLFVQLDYQCVFSGSGCDPLQENLYPSPDPTTGADPLAIVTQAFKQAGIVLHLQVGNAVPESTCTDSPGQLCEFPGDQGVIGWKNDLEFSKLWPRNYNSCATGGDCTTRFPYGQKDSYHYVLFAHSLAIPAWSTRFGSLLAINASALTGQTTITTTNRGPNIPTNLNYCPSRFTIAGVLSDSSLNGVYNTASCPDGQTIILSTPGVSNWSYSGNTPPEPDIGLISSAVTSISGYSDLGGQDSAVTLGLWETSGQNMATRANVIAGTLFHEIGHTIGLSHGGLYYQGGAGSYIPTFDINCKPNYQSSMNYLFQLDGVGPTLAVTYSKQTLESLTEASLGSVSGLVDLSDVAASYPSSSWYTIVQPSPTTSWATSHCDGTPLNPGEMDYRVTGSVASPGPGWTTANEPNITFDGVAAGSTGLPGLVGYNDINNIDLRQVGATGGEFASLASVLSFGTSVTPLSIPPGGSATLGAGGTATVPAGGSVTLSSTGRNVTVGSGAVLTGGGAITFNTGTNVMFSATATDNMITAGPSGVFTLPVGGNVTLNNTGKVTLTLGGTITIPSTSPTAITVTFGGSGSIAMGGGGVTTIPSAGGSVTVPALTGATITLPSSGSITMGGGGSITMGGGGSITMGGGGSITMGGGGSITMGGGGSITMGGGGSITMGGGGSITMGGGGSITMGGGGSITMGGGGSITMGGGGSVTVGTSSGVTLGDGGVATVGLGGSITVGIGGSVTVNSTSPIGLSSGGSITMGGGGSITMGGGGIQITMGGLGGTIAGTPEPAGYITTPPSGTVIGLPAGGSITMGGGGSITMGGGGSITMGGGGSITMGGGGSITMGGGGGIVNLGSSGGSVTMGGGGSVTMGGGGSVTMGGGGATTDEMSFGTANSVVRPPVAPTYSTSGNSVVVSWTAPAFGVVQTYTVSREVVDSHGNVLQPTMVIGSVSGVGNPPSAPATTFTDTNPPSSGTVIYTIATTLVPDTTGSTPRSSAPSPPAVLTTGQTIVLGQLPSSVALGSTQPTVITVTAIAESNNSANLQLVSFSTTGPCSAGNSTVDTTTGDTSYGVSSAPVTLSNTGSCTITATQAGNSTTALSPPAYSAAAPVSGTIMILPQGSQTKSQSITFGPAPTVQYGSNGFTVSATASPSGLPVSFSAPAIGPCTVGATTNSANGKATGAGLCTITATAPAGTVSGNSYSAASVTQSFNIAAAPLTVAAVNLSSTYGQPLPSLSPNLNVNYALTGFVNGDTASIVGGAPALSTNATSTSDAGSYTITVSTGTLAAANYSFVYSNGMLTINAAGSTTATSNQTATYSPGSQVVALSAAVTSTAGTVNAGTVTFTVLNNGTPVGTATTSGTVSSGKALVNYTLPAGTAPGTYTIQAVYNGSTDFTGSSDSKHTLTVKFTASAPPSGTSCNGAYNGTFNGNLTVTKGQNCVFIGGGTTGTITETGGNLVLNGSTVVGGVTVSGGTFSIGPSTTLRSTLVVQNLPSGGTTNQVCGSTITGSIQFQKNQAPVLFGAGSSCAGNVIKGTVAILSNTAAVTLDGNKITGGVQVQSNSGTTTTDSNTIGGGLQIQSNTGAAQVFINIITGSLQCQSNISITGSGNTASSKSGQCAKF